MCTNGQATFLEVATKASDTEVVDIRLAQRTWVGASVQPWLRMPPVGLRFPTGGLFTRPHGGTWVSMAPLSLGGR